VSFFAWPLVVDRSSLKVALTSRFGSVQCVKNHFSRKELMKLFYRRLTQTALVCVGLCWLVRHYTIEHPFLLADNRHYPFYVWRKIYKRHWTIRYALTPVYVLAFSVIKHALARDGQLRLFQSLAFGLVTSLTLIPSPLIEPRYFIVPYVLLRLHLRPSSKKVAFELGWYALINATTLCAFLYKPFKWPSEPMHWQRFMW
jgi:alpha-1,2-glucosyltransferase